MLLLLPHFETLGRPSIVCSPAFSLVTRGGGPCPPYTTGVCIGKDGLKPETL